MKKVTFYLLNKNINNISVVEQITCELATRKWREGKRVLIVCKDKTQALKLDIDLWIWQPNSFIPHNLVSESSIHHSAPIELTWPQKNHSIPRDLLIRLPLQCPGTLYSSFEEIIEFVPNEEPLKMLARKRYKAYQNIGFQLIIAQLPAR